MGFKIDHLGWIEPLKSHAKRVGRPCVFIVHIGEPEVGQYTVWVDRLVALLGRDLFFARQGCLVFDDLDEAMRWTNTHDEKDWWFFAVCIDGTGEPRTDNT
jgi:hypothetical protein